MDWYIRSSGLRQLGEPATQRFSLEGRGERWTRLTDWERQIPVKYLECASHCVGGAMTIKTGKSRSLSGEVTV